MNNDTFVKTLKLNIDNSIQKNLVGVGVLSNEEIENKKNKLFTIVMSFLEKHPTFNQEQECYTTKEIENLIIHSIFDTI